MSEKKRDVQLVEKRVRPVEYTSSYFDAVLPPDHTLEDILTPRYWSHTAIKFNPGDIINIRYDDGSHYGRFYVVDCSRVHVSLHKLEWVELGATEVLQSEEYKYKWRGPLHKHCVIRVSDDQVVAEQLPTKAAALEWMVKQKRAA